MLISLAALVLGTAAPSQGDDRFAESRCIFEEAERIARAGDHDPVAKAEPICVARYHWTAGDASRARLVGASLTEIFSARSEILKAGLKAADVDAIVSAVGEDDLTTLGDPATPEAARSPIVIKLGIATAAKYGVGEKSDKARRVVLGYAALMYAAHAFEERYGQAS